MTKAQERAREMMKLINNDFCDISKPGVPNIMDYFVMIYAQGQRDLVEAARGIRRWMINLDDLAKLAGVDVDNKA